MAVSSCVGAGRQCVLPHLEAARPASPRAGGRRYRVRVTGLRDAQLELVGDPPRAVRAARELPAAAVAEMLQAPSAPALLELLGITGQDLAELSALIGPAVEDPEILAEVTRTANLLRAGAGLE